MSLPQSTESPPILRSTAANSSEFGVRDSLTGLPGRQQLVDALAALFAPPNANPALILLDLDRFKLANDGFGTEVGDALLCRVSQRLVSLAKGAVMVARVSGDGFGVLLADTVETEAVALRILDYIGRPYAVSGHSVTISASVGFAMAPEDGFDAASLFYGADLALHQAEKDGRSRLRRFASSMQTTASVRQKLESDLRAALTLQQVELRRALVSEQFEVHYQPQVCLADGRLKGFEALLRWRHPLCGWISPAEFIPIAEEIGLIELVGEWVMRIACRDAAAWPVPLGGRPLRIAVNVSPLQLRDGPSLLAAIARAAMEAGLPLKRLELEITENALVCDVAETLLAIKQMGCELALDDFGTGYSSLGRLRNLPFDRIKIDRSFMLDLAEEAADEARSSAMWMVRAIASLGSGLGQETIAEGIETEGQAALARDAGCTEMQGFLVSRAIPNTEVADFIVNHVCAEKGQPLHD
ncbi:putative bifunctional diguanylate cyclase/phosphodiesterase [Sphingomonas glacialis]|uniref:Bifunctional diguanylate cyclase/phosphodiesterase n=1 Tax=Sphingomonas glacialis TaxID=658225 RepID=A0A502FAW1_9SPHN|nr:bifunctional diguanylate cyclase/phosphodiesterase [Sphingomonas glacialis]TPG46568.1 bifunctional diguanylate cyclase/phosphodiesterase [Sphingomonas glacialis]